MPPTVTPVQWDQSWYYKPEHFKHPEKMDDSVVAALSVISSYFDKRFPILDDFSLRPNNPKSQHPLGRAIDFAAPGIDSAAVLGAIRKSGLVSGFGLYTNEKNVQSYHIDTRTDRTPQNPAIWGAWKDRSQGITDWQYGSITSILDLVKKSPANIMALMFAGIIAYLMFRK